MTENPVGKEDCPLLLLTADGTDDELIKLEGTPPKYKLSIPTYTY